MERKKIILFGSGNYGRDALNVLNRDEIECFLDNNEEKAGKQLENIPIYCFKNYPAEELKKHHIIITVSRQYTEDIEKQLRNAGVTDYEKYADILRRIGREKIRNRPDHIALYGRAKQWIINNSHKEKTGRSIINSTSINIGYPEVTGYYIPSLIRWGFRDLAKDYSDWLISIQRKDGAFLNTDGTEGYVFDTAQVLKGLLAAKEKFGNKYDEAILKACDWIVSNMKSDGRLTTPDMTDWNNDISLELIHIYCISPLKEAAKIFNRQDWAEAAEKIWNYYRTNHLEDILSFKRLIHFHAYLMEALLDIGEQELAAEGMKRLEKYVDEFGYVPAYPHQHWICSTGLFQLAIVWFRLGNTEYGNKVFEYVLKFQNESGGWFGSYMTPEAEKAGEENDYFSSSEISWAVKFFLDALYYKNRTEFNISAPKFQVKGISKEDGRYLEVRNTIAKKSKSQDKALLVCDAGCGNGRYLKNLIEDFPDVEFYGTDISESALRMIPEKVKTAEGTLTCLPYDNNVFDLVYTCEALEHAVDIDQAVREINRVLKPDGMIVVVDKTVEALGEMEIGAWEQWFGKEDFLEKLKKSFKKVQRHDSIPYDGIKGDTFSAWLGEYKNEK